MTDLLFCDTETIHLDPFAGSVWEIAWATLDSDVTTFQVAPVLAYADEKALEVGGFRTRWDGLPSLRSTVAKALRGALDGRPALTGSAPWFDAAHIAANWPGLAGLWHHHHVDVPTLCAGLGRATGWHDVPVPWRLSQAAEVAGLDLGSYERHSAAGDVLLTRDLYLMWRDG